MDAFRTKLAEHGVGGYGLNVIAAPAAYDERPRPDRGADRGGRGGIPRRGRADHRRRRQHVVQRHRLEPHVGVPLEPAASTRPRSPPPNTRRPYFGALRRLYARPRARGRDPRRLPRELHDQRGRAPASASTAVAAACFPGPPPLLATCHRPRRRGRTSSPSSAGRLGAVIAGLLFHGRDALEVSALYLGRRGRRRRMPQVAAEGRERRPEPFGRPSPPRSATKS